MTEQMLNISAMHDVVCASGVLSSPIKQAMEYIALIGFCKVSNAKKKRLLSQQPPNHKYPDKH